jgi:hypothetical protein
MSMIELQSTLHGSSQPVGRPSSEQERPRNAYPYLSRLSAARHRGWLEHGDPATSVERERRRRLARVLLWAAEGRLAELIASGAVRSGSEVPFGLLRMPDPARQWARWRRRAGEVFEEHLVRGRDHWELDRLAAALDAPRADWPSPSSLAESAELARPSARARRVRAQALLHEGRSESAARSLAGLLGPGASPADRLAGCLGWARLHGSARRPGAARHALRAAVRRAPLAPEVWRLAHALATELNDRPTRDQLARGARVVRRLERAREVRSAVSRANPEPASPAPPAGSSAGLCSRSCAVVEGASRAARSSRGPA